MDTDHQLCLDSPDPSSTRALGASLALAWVRTHPVRHETAGGGAAPGMVVSLQGALGAGKTVFVKGLARGLGIHEESVSSPTFVLANQYPIPARGHTLHHVDFYRLESAAELETMGFFDLMAEGSLLVVEWGGKFAHELPDDRIELEIAANREAGTDARRISAAGTGPAAKRLLEAWRVSLEEDGLIGKEVELAARFESLPGTDSER